ncbi:MAG: hypothetical protein M3N50_11700 [Pseudomonadota bacterium]|nr:hypothetical protein [Pseudomonadota bacterium]
MRKNNAIGWHLSLWAGAAAVLCLLMPDPALTGLVQTAPNLAVPATALGLTLITAANRDRP